MNGRALEVYDGVIYRHFNHIVFLFVILSVVFFCVVYRHELSVSKLLLSICIVFAGGFIVLGIPPALLRRKKSLYPRWKVILSLALVSVAIGLGIWFVFGKGAETPSGFIAAFFNILVQYASGTNIVTVTGGVVVLTLFVTLGTYGVMEVLYVKLGTDYHRVLLSLMKPRNGRLKRTALKLFSVPDIIDVDEVVLHPRKPQMFDGIIFKETIKDVFIIGTVISSYLFLNPVFLQSIHLSDMMLIIVLLSLFIPALTVPYILTVYLGADALSKGNRPFSL